MKNIRIKKAKFEKSKTKERKKKIKTRINKI